MGRFLLELDDVCEEMILEIYINNVYFCEIKLRSNNMSAWFDDLGEGWKNVEIYLDQANPFKLKKVLIDDESYIKRIVHSKKRWIHYGSFISHSMNVCNLSKIWTAAVARKLDLHLTNLGFGANCIIEPMIGMLIREKHKEVHLVLMLPIYCPEREDIPGESGLCLKDMRKIIESIIGSFIKYGDENIYYVDGLRLLSADNMKSLPDGVHPDASGQKVQTDNFIRKVF